jgi:hypothetical protein
LGRPRRTGRVTEILRNAAAFVLAAGALVALAACGTSFSPESFIEKANANGAGLTLGPPIGTTQPGKKAYEVTLSVPAGTPKPAGEENGLTGTLYRYDDDGGADKGLTECEAATGRLCYQAGNVVLIFEGDQPNALQTRLAVAMKKMAG